MTLPVEVLLGIYLGLLTGIVPALVAGTLGFVVRYFTGVTLPGFGVVVLALSIASVQGGLLGLIEPTITQSPRLFIAVLVVLMLSLYAHSQGDKLGTTLPRHVSFRNLRQRTLSADVVEFVGTMGQVTIRPTGEIKDMEGYPSLSTELREQLKTDMWRLPADIPLSELEFRSEERLRTKYDLADVAVSIDERGNATIVAAPPTGWLSRRVPTGSRAISLETLVPTGLAYGDIVTIQTRGREIEGTVVSVRSDMDTETDVTEAAINDATPADTTPATDETSPATSQRATSGGAGRVTVSVPRAHVRPVLESKPARLVVQSRGSSRTFDALAAIKRAGHTIRRVSIGTGSVVNTDDYPEVSILAVRRQASTDDESQRGWTFSPNSLRRLDPGDEVFAAGPEGVLETFQTTVGR